MKYHQCARCKVWVLPWAEFQFDGSEWLCAECFTKLLNSYLTKADSAEIAIRQTANEIDPRRA